MPVPADFDQHQRRKQQRDDDRARDTHPDRAPQPHDGEADQRATAQGSLERTSGQLGDRVSAHPDREEERGQRRHERAGVERRGRGRAKRNVAQVQRRVRRMKQRDEIAPAAARQGVESGPVEPTELGFHP